LVVALDRPLAGKILTNSRSRETRDQNVTNFPDRQYKTIFNLLRPTSVQRNQNHKFVAVYDQILTNKNKKTANMTFVMAKRYFLFSPNKTYVACTDSFVKN